jgi:LysM repeat protein
MAYTVKPNDSFWRIAEQQLGDGSRWKEVAAANNLAENATIRPGQVLNIPGQAAPAPPPDAPVRTPSPTTQPAPETQTAPSQDEELRREIEELRNQIERDRQEREQPQLDRVSARTIIDSILDSIGLGDLAETVMGIITRPEQLTEAFIMGTIRPTDQYKARFVGNEARRAAGLNVLREDVYLNLEDQMRTVMRNAGLPIGFHDTTQDLARFIAGDVSPGELGNRINQGYRAISEADQTTIDTMRRFYGVSDGQLAAFFLDPDVAEPMLMQQVATVQIGAAAARSGFENVIERTAAERLRQAGVTGDQAGEVFGFLGAGRELLSPLEAGETELDVADTALGLAGQSPEALQRLRTQQRRRQARFEGGGALATTGAGVTGLREA